MDDEAGVLLGAPAVLALVAARQEPTAAHGEPGGNHAVHPELLAGGAHVALGRRRDDDGVVALPVVPLEPAPRVVAQVSLQVPVGEGCRAAGDLVDREAAQQAAEQLLLHLVRRRAAREGGAQQGRSERDHGAQHGEEPAQAHQEREHAPRVGERAVEVEGGDRRASRHGRPRRVGVSRSQRHRGPHPPQIVPLPPASHRCE